MGDIWLRGHPPAYTDWGHCLIELQRLGMGRDNAKILAAIAGPESGFDWTVINDTPSTGDYSVGLWQINYLGSLYPSRARAYGTPLQMVSDGLGRQAHAALSVWRSQGFDAWYNTYHSGAWKKYIGSGPVPSPPGFPGSTPPPPPRELARNDWSGRVRRSAAQFHNTSMNARKWGAHINNLRIR